VAFDRVNFESRAVVGRRRGGKHMRDSRAKPAFGFVRVTGICLPLLLVLLFLTVARMSPHTLRIPELSGDKKAIYASKGVVIDYGNASQGYVFIKYKETDKHLKIRISVDKKVYTYDLNRDGEYEVFPLQMGNGKYKAQVFQEVKNGSYMQLGGKTIDVTLDDPSLPFLYPSQYVNYGADSVAVATSFELCDGAADDHEKIKTIFVFCSRQIQYHYERASSSKAGYLPDIDAVLEERKGICFDYAALMACMLRVQGIPTQLVIGYADRLYHAWNNVKVDDKWYRYDPTFASTGNTVQSYTEERRY
jgi:hypothetical protein